MTTLKKKKITITKKVDTEDGLLKALNDVRGPGFGQVGHHVAYKVDPSLVKDLSFEGGLYLEHAIKSGYRRLDTEAVKDFRQALKGEKK